MTTQTKPYSRVIYDWTAEKIALLGTMSDGAVAERIGGKADAVRAKRQLLKIKPHKPKVGPTKGGRRPNFDWTTEAVSLLGTMPDGVVARKLGLSSSAVSTKRRALGIASKNPRPPAIAFPKNLIRHLGKRSDARIAAEIGASPGAIANIRRNRQIKAAMEFNSLPNEAIPLLGTMTDRSLASQFGVAFQTIANHRKKLGIPAFRQTAVEPSTDVLAALGTASDRALAAEHDLSVETVRAWRRARGIKPWRGSEAAADHFKEQSFALPIEEMQLLGIQTDKEIATRNGVSHPTIRRLRIAAGIPPTISKPRFPSEMAHLLGTMPDQELAKMTGLSPSGVASHRVAKGISAFGSNRK